jgi:hypothetical protein
VRRFYLDYEHFIQVLKTGAVDVVKNQSELGESLSRALRDPAWRSAERRRLVAMECGVVDGGAGGRLADVFGQMAQSAVDRHDPSYVLETEASG